MDALPPDKRERHPGQGVALEGTRNNAGLLHDAVTTAVLAMPQHLGPLLVVSERFDLSVVRIRRRRPPTITLNGASRYLVVIDDHPNGRGPESFDVARTAAAMRWATRAFLACCWESLENYERVCHAARCESVVLIGTTDSHANEWIAFLRTFGFDGLNFEIIAKVIEPERA